MRSSTKFVWRNEDRSSKQRVKIQVVFQKIFKNFKGSKKKKANQDKLFDPEYYSLPPIENLCISVKEDAKMERFGVVETQIDFIGFVSVKILF